MRWKNVNYNFYRACFFCRMGCHCTKYSCRAFVTLPWKPQLIFSHLKAHSQENTNGKFGLKKWPNKSFSQQIPRRIISPIKANKIKPQHYDINSIPLLWIKFCLDEKKFGWIFFADNQTLSTMHVPTVTGSIQPHRRSKRYEQAADMRRTLVHSASCSRLYNVCTPAATSGLWTMFGNRTFTLRGFFL